MQHNFHSLAASAKRQPLPPRPLEEIYRLPPHALLTAAEASLVTRLTEPALAVRRSKGQWPPYEKFGKLVRYVLGQLVVPPTSGDLP